MEILLVDYGMGNLRNVARAVERVGAKPRLSADPDDVRRADRLLIPGVGAQGGDPKAVMAAAAGGTGPIVVTSSRSILYASQGVDFADRARDAATQLRDDLNRAR